MSAEDIVLHKPQEAPVLLDADKRALLKKTLCPRDITDNEFDLFEAICLRTGLDPFKKQIYAVKRGGKLCIDASIDGLRLIAARSNEYAGQEGPFWCGEDGVWHDVWLASKPPSASKVGVWRSGFKTPVWGVALFKSFAPYYNGKLGDMWTKMGDIMIAKCAESQALRKAFPAEMSGIYSSDEMQQADTVAEIVNTPTGPVNTQTAEVIEEATPEATEEEKEAAKIAQALKARRIEVMARFKLDFGPQQLAEWLDQEVLVMNQGGTTIHTGRTFGNMTAEDLDAVEAGMKEAEEELIATEKAIAAKAKHMGYEGDVAILVQSLTDKEKPLYGDIITAWKDDTTDWDAVLGTAHDKCKEAQG